MSEVTFERTFDGKRLLRAVWRGRVTQETIDYWWDDHEENDGDCRETCIYVIQEENQGHVKIGISDDPEARLASMQTCNPRELSLVLAITGCKHVEKLIHGDLFGHRIRGEWFRYEGRVVETVEALLEIDEAEWDEAFGWSAA